MNNIVENAATVGYTVQVRWQIYKMLVLNFLRMLCIKNRENRMIFDVILTVIQRSRNSVTSVQLQNSFFKLKFPSCLRTSSKYGMKQQTHGQLYDITVHE